MSSEIRIEKDSMGEIEVQKDKFWGPQTQRSLQNFNIHTQVMPNAIIKAFGIIKKACANANYEIGKIKDEKIFNAISQACDKIISGELNDNFPLKVWQTGSGTQTNMNANEVIAGYANYILTGKINSKNPVHPNDHCNMHQSSNDTFPSAMHVASYMEYENLKNALESLESIFRKLSIKYKDSIKIGRTHFMDATPVTFMQVFDNFASQIERVKNNISHSIDMLLYLPQGGTAVGSGINCHEKFPSVFINHINKITQKSFKESKVKYCSIASHDEFVQIAGSITTLCSILMKIGSDLKFMASGPRCGTFEISIPSNEPGSSIMPGKVNPTQLEALTMVAAHVMGSMNSVSIANSFGHCELNVYKPMIAFNILDSMEMLASCINNVIEKCIKDIKVNQDVVNEKVNMSLMLVTPLAKKIGYDNAAKVAKLAFDKNTTLLQAALELNLISEKEFKEIVRPESMVGFYKE